MKRQYIFQNTLSTVRQVRSLNARLDKDDYVQTDNKNLVFFQPANRFLFLKPRTTSQLASHTSYAQIKTCQSACFIYALFTFFLFTNSVLAVKYSFPSSLSAITGTTSYCQYSSATSLSVTITNSTCGSGAPTDNNITVKWYSNTTLSNTGGTLVSTINSTTATTTFTYFPSTSTVGTLYYYVEVSWIDPDGASACTAGTLVSTTGQMIAILINSLPTADAGPNQAICDAGSILIGGSPTATDGLSPYTYLWSPTTNLNSSTISNPTCSATSTTTYTVTVTDNNGCTDSDYMIVAIGSPGCASGFSPASGSTFACGTSTTLSWTAPSGGPNYKIYLETSSPPTILVSTQETSSYTTEMLLENTTYYWMIVPTNACGDATGCTVQSFTTSTAINPPSASDVARCGTGTVSLNASGGTYPHYYWYNAPSGGTLLSTSSSYTTPSISNTTTYYVQDENAAPETFNATGLTSTTACGTPPQSTDFDITNNSSTQNVLITKIAVQFGATTTQQVRIYVRDGTYLGNDGSSSGWILIYMASPRTKQGQTLILDVSDFCITPNGIVGVYIWTSNKHYVTTAAGPFSNTDISISNGNVGCTMSSPFSTTPQNSGYGLNGAVYYRVLDAGSPCARCISSRTPVKAIVDNITTQPTAQTVCDGTSANFSLIASGTSLTYQWRKNGVNIFDGGNILGSATSTLTINPSSSSDAANYDVIVSGVCTSNSVSLTVNNNPTATITPSGPTTICSGGSVTLVSSPASSYLWSTSETTQAISAISGLNYTVTVTDGNGCTGAVNQIITENNVAGGAVTSNQTICNGGDPAVLTESIASTGSGILTYQWQSGTINCSSGFSNLSGESNTTYDPPSGQFSTTYYRRVTTSILNGVNCNANSNCITITVLPAVNYGGIIPLGDEYICSDDIPNSISVTATEGSGSFSYQWYYKSEIVDCPTGNSIIGWTSLGSADGANTDTYTPSTGITNSRTYTVFVTPGGSPSCGTAQWSSNCKKVNVNQKSMNPTSATATSTSICNGNSSNLMLNGGGGGTSEIIKWYTVGCGGTPEGTGNNLSVSPVSNTTYYGRYEDPAPCNYNSSCASITINVNVCTNTITTTTIIPSPNICRGGNITVNYNLTETYNPGNIFTAQLSDASGNFITPINIGSVNSTTNDPITATIPTEQSIGSGYRIRVVSSDPGVTGSDNGSNLTVPGNCIFYWVGGAGNWNDATHWSLTSGGSGGAGTPNIHINVYIDDNSGTSSAIPISMPIGTYYTKQFNITGTNGSRTPFIGQGSLLPRPNSAD